MCSKQVYNSVCVFTLLTHEGRRFSVRHVAINVRWPRHLYISYCKKNFLSENLHCTIDNVTNVVFVDVLPSIYLQTSSSIRNNAECAIICVFVTGRLPLLYEKVVGLVLDFVLFVPNVENNSRCLEIAFK